MTKEVANNVNSKYVKRTENATMQQYQWKFWTPLGHDRVMAEHLVSKLRIFICNWNAGRLHETLLVWQLPHHSTMTNLYKETGFRIAKRKIFFSHFLLQSQCVYVRATCPSTKIIKNQCTRNRTSIQRRKKKAECKCYFCTHTWQKTIPFFSKVPRKSSTGIVKNAIKRHLHCNKCLLCPVV